MCGGGKPGRDNGSGIEGDAAGAEIIGGEGDDCGDSAGEAAGEGQIKTSGF
jgi:hypothetical protein